MSANFKAVYYDSKENRFFYLNQDSGTAREYIQIGNPENKTTQKSRFELDLSRTESVSSEDKTIMLEAVRSQDGSFLHLEILDKRNKPFDRNLSVYWDGLDYVTDLMLPGSEAQIEFKREFGEENLEHAIAFVKQLNEEDWFTD